MKREMKCLRVALIGGAGFIGHTLAMRLKELGAEIHIIDSLLVNNLMSFIGRENENENALSYQSMVDERLSMLRSKDIPLYAEDARDYHKMCHILEEIQPQVIMHLAAVAHANRSNKDPKSTFDHSFRTLENALDAYRGLKGEKHFIYLSSSMVYGNFSADTVTEESPCDPLGIYAALKYSGEKIVIAYNQVFDLPYTIIRPSSVYGERDVGRRVGQAFIENAMRGKDITINGDGSDYLDFTYVQDLVSGIISVMENDASKNQTFNLTYGNSRSLLELSEIIQKNFPETKIVFHPREALMPKRGTLSVDKAKKLIGYDPQFPIDIGMQRYIDWYKTMEKVTDSVRQSLFITR